MKKILVILSLMVSTFSAWGSSPKNDIDIFSYNVEILPNERTKSIDAKIVKIFTTKRNTKKLYFPASGIQISSIHIDGVKAIWKIEKDDAVVFLPSEARNGSKLEVKITYSGRPVGIFFGEDYFYSNYSSCMWLLCDDRSGDRFSLTLKLKVPDGWEAIGTGDLVGTTENVQTWKSSKEISGFLVGFFLGKSDVSSITSQGKTLRLHSKNLTSSNVAHVFRKTNSAINFFEERAGFELPNSTYTQVVVPERIAQEKSSFSMLGLPFLEPMFSAESEDWLIVHELAHQWWGNSITCADWSHFWLNEGITVFMVAAYKEKTWGKAHYEREMALARRRYSFAVSQGFDVPLSYAGKYPSLRIKRAITYSKGALFMDALRKRFGDEVFWKAFRKYSADSKGKLVISKDFQRAFEGVVGSSLQKVFDEWVY